MSVPNEEPIKSPADDTNGATEHYDAAVVARARAVLYEPPEQIGPYRILERVGGGGMGDVYRAEQREGVRREVAIKLIRPGFDTRNVIARFEAERQALAMMHHPHIAQVFAAGNDDTGRPYFVMEYVPGKPVTQFADENKLTVRQRLALFLQICSAISHAHTKLIIHRDIKSSNVMAYFDDQKQPMVKVIDFGVAKALSGKALSDATLYTAHGEVLGTYDSMSPEQAAGSSDIDTRTDVYSLGVLLYELLTGAKPFDYAREADHEIRRIIRDVEPPPPSTRLSSLGEAGERIAAARRSHLEALAKELSSELEWIPLMAMRKERDRRYESPAALAADVERYLGGEPLEAGPETLAYRAQKFLRKHRGAIAAVGAIIAALTFGIVGTGTMSMRYRAASAREAARADSEAKAREAAELESYIANVSAAQSALSSDSYTEARERLSACAESRRGWEWKLLQQQANSAVGTVPARFEVKGFTPDGKRMLAVASDGKVQCWDMSGHPIGESISVGLRAGGSDIAKLTPNGRQIVTASKAGVIGLWDLDGRPVHPLVKTGEEWEGVKFSADGTKILSFGANNSLGTWDLEGRRLGGPITVEGVRQSGADFTRDSKRLILTSKDRSGDNVYQIWDTNLKPLGSKILERWDIEHRRYFDLIVWSGDGTSITLTAGAALLRDTTGSEIAKLVIGNEKWKFAKFSPDGKFVFTRSKDVGCLWDNSGKLIGEPFRSCREIEFSPDGKRIAVSDAQGIVIWDLPGRPTGEAIDAGKSSFSFSDDSRRIVTSDGEYDSGWDRVWDLSGHPLGEEIPSDGYESLSPNGSHLLEVLYDEFEGIGERMWLFDISGRRLGCWDNGRTFNYPEFTPDGKHIVVTREGSPSLVVSVDNFATPVERIDDEVKRKWLVELAKSASVEPTGSLAALSRRLLVRVQGDRRIEVLDASSSAVVHTIGGERLHASAATTDHHGTRVVTAGDDEDPSVRFWETNSWRNVATFRLSVGVTNIEFSPDDTRLIVTLNDGTVEIWDARPQADRQKDRDIRFANRIPARKYLDELLSSDTPSEKFEAAIDRDKSLPAGWKLAAIEELDIRRTRMEDYSGQVWDQLIASTQPGKTYSKIGKGLKDTIRLIPANKHNFNALGYWQYRHGDFADAIATLNRSEAIDPDAENLGPGKRRHMADWAFLAMAHFRLNNKPEAKKCLAAFQEMYKASDDARKQRYKNLADEAESLVGSGPETPANPADTKPMGGTQESSEPSARDRKSVV